MARSSLATAFRTGLTTKSAGVPVRGNGVWGMVREPFAGAWQQGVSVDPIGSITSYSAVFACIKQIAEDIAKLEIKLKSEQSGIWVDAPPTSPYWRVLRKPNGYQNRIQFLISWLCAKLMHGNSYMLKERADLRGMVTALYPLDPRRVTPQVTPQGDVYYSIGGDDLSRIPGGGVVPASEIIHDRGITLWHPLLGVSPLYACAMSATQGNRIQSNSAKFFENMSRPSGMLTGPGTIDDVTAKRLKNDWERNYSKENIGRLAIAGDGLKYEPMTIPAEQSQLIEQLEWTAKDVARAFGVPAYKIGAGPRPSDESVEASEIAYYTSTLQILIESIELCLTEGLDVPVGAYAELDLDGLLRMDSAAQIEMLTKAAGGAFMKTNEARRKRNLPPAAGGDTIYLQQQNYSLEALAKRDAMPDPFSAGKAAPSPAPVAAEPTKGAEVLAADLVAAVQSAADAASRRMVDDGSRIVEQLRALVEGQQRASHDAGQLEVLGTLKSLPEAIVTAVASAADAKAAPAPDLSGSVAELQRAVTSLPEAIAKAMASPDEDEEAQAEALAKSLSARFAALEIAAG